MIGSAMLLFIQSLQGAKADYLVMARVKHSQKLSAPLQNHLNSLATPDPSNNHDDSITFASRLRRVVVLLSTTRIRRDDCLVIMSSAP